MREAGRPFGEVLRSLLRQRGWSQGQLADRLGVKQPVVNAILNGKMRFPPARLDTLLEILEVSEGMQPHYRMLYVISTAPAEVRRAAMEMYLTTAFKTILSMGVEQLLSSLESLDARDSLPEGAAQLAKRTFMREVLDALLELEAFTKEEHQEHVKRLGSARPPADFTRIIAWIAASFMRVTPSEEKIDALDRLVNLLQDESVERYSRMALTMVEQASKGSRAEPEANRRRRKARARGARKR